MLQTSRNAVHHHQLDASLGDFLIGRRGGGEIDRDRDDPVGALLDEVLDIRDLLVQLPTRIGDADQLDAVFVERIGNPLDLQLRPVKVGRHDRDADLEVPGLDLRCVFLGQREAVGRGRFFAVKALSDDRLCFQRGHIDAFKAGCDRIGHRRRGQNRMRRRGDQRCQHWIE